MEIVEGWKKFFNKRPLFGLFILTMLVLFIGCLSSAAVTYFIVSSHYESLPPNASGNVTTPQASEECLCPNSTGGNVIGDTTGGTEVDAFDPASLGCTAMKKIHRFSEFIGGAAKTGPGGFVMYDCVDDPRYRPGFDHQCLPDQHFGRMRAFSFTMTEKDISYECKLKVKDYTECRWQNVHRYRPNLGRNLDCFPS